MEDFPISQLRLVILTFWNKEMTEPDYHKTRRYMVHELDVDLLVEASIRLHYDPGVNPHIPVRLHERNGEVNKTTSVLNSIRVSRLMDGQSYWWTGPSLGITQEGTEAAKIIDFEYGKMMWMHPQEVARVRAAQNEFHQGEDG